MALLDAPAGFDTTLGALPDAVTVRRDLAGADPVDVTVLFVTERHELAARLDGVRRRMAQDGGFWVAWPKRSSKVPTDITEDVIREVALPMGYVDIKVCAVTDVWSGLKLVIRKELR